MNLICSVDNIITINIYIKEWKHDFNDELLGSKHRNVIETHNSQVKRLKLTIIGLIYITSAVSAHDYFSYRLRF